MPKADIHVGNALTEAWEPLLHGPDENAFEVWLGNPPYNGFAGVAVAEEGDLCDAYRWKEGDPDDLDPQGQGLNDLYVRSVPC